MSIERLNSQRSNIKYLLTCLFKILDEQKVEREFRREYYVVKYNPHNGMTLEGRIPKIIVNQNGVELPDEFTSVSQIPYEWINTLQNELKNN